LRSTCRAISNFGNARYTFQEIKQPYLMASGSTIKKEYSPISKYVSF